jgi:predicted PurR-regulated permease PerM
MQDRWIRVRVRTVLAIIALVLAVWGLLSIVSVALQVITWVLIALFFALALNPFVELLVRHGVRRRGLAVTITIVLVLIGFAAIGYLFIPTLIDQVNRFIDKVPDYVEDLTKGEGRLGFLERDYQIVERVKELTEGDAARRAFGLTDEALGFVSGVVTVIVAIITIFVMVIFMLLEGPAWVERFFGLLPADAQVRWRRVAYDIYRVVGGYVSGNLLISVIAGITSTVVLLIVGVDYAVALGLLVALLDLIPLAGATIAAVLVTAVSAIESITAAIVVGIFFVVYQQIENHFLQPVIYGRTVQLSPLAVLIAVLIGAQVAGVLGALAAIPIAGAIQVILVDYLSYRREKIAVTAAEAERATAAALAESDDER